MTRFLIAALVCITLAGCARTVTPTKESAAKQESIARRKKVKPPPPPPPPPVEPGHTMSRDFSPDDYLDCGDVNDFSFAAGTPKTICCWVKRDDPRRADVIAKKFSSGQEEWQFGFHSDYFLYATIYQSAGTYIGRRTTYHAAVHTTWTFLAFVYDGGTTNAAIKIFKGHEGLECYQIDHYDYSSGSFSAPVNGTAALQWGNGLGTSDAVNLDGKMTLMRIFSTAKTSAQLTTIKDNTSAYLIADGCLGDWKGDGTTDETDRSGNGNTGTNNGAGTSAEEPTLTFTAAPVAPVLPTAVVDMPYSLPTGTTRTASIVVDDLQSLLDATQYNDVLILPAGYTWTGQYTLTGSKTGTGWIYIISSAMASLPAEGTRVGASDTANMPTIFGTSGGAGGALRVAPGINRVRIAGVQFAEASSSTAATYSLGFPDLNETPVGTGISDQMVIDRCYFHSNGKDHLIAGVSASYVTNLKVVDSWFDCRMKHLFGPAENYAVTCVTATGPTLIHNNYMQVTGITCFIGENWPNVTIANRDLTFTRNHCKKLPSWYNLHGTWAGIDYTIKNLFEIKCCLRALVEGNTLENCWYEDQQGEVMLYNAHSGPINDLTVRGNFAKEFQGGIQLSPTIGIQYFGAAADFTMQRISIQDNVFITLNDAVISDYMQDWVKITPYRSKGMTDVRYEHNTMLSRRGLWRDTTGSWASEGVSDEGGSHRSTVLLEGTTGGGSTWITEHATRIQFLNNIFSCGDYLSLLNAGGGTGKDAWNNGTGQHLFQRNHITDYSYLLTNLYPEDTYFLELTYTNDRNDVGFTDTAFLDLEDFRLTTASPYDVAATDGGPLGARIDNILAYMGGVGNLKITFLRP